jgi:hypothetical protein
VPLRQWKEIQKMLRALESTCTRDRVSMNGVTSSRASFLLLEKEDGTAGPPRKMLFENATFSLNLIGFRPGPLNELAARCVMEHGTQTTRGKCYDCSQGLLIPAEGGFEYWNEDGDDRGFWFCRYCGSNHVAIIDDKNTLVEQGNLYDPDGLPNF